MLFRLQLKPPGKRYSVFDEVEFLVSILFGRGRKAGQAVSFEAACFFMSLDWTSLELIDARM